MSLVSRFNLPTREELLASRLLRPFRHHLGASVLWRWNRRSVARGAALGLFVGLLVPLLQIPAAAVFAVFARANLAVAALCTLLTNPLTTPAIYVGAYMLGTAIIDVEEQTGMQRGNWFDSTIAWLAQASVPTALGLLVIASTASAIGYVGVHQVWRWRVARRWQRRARQRRPV